MDPPRRGAWWAARNRPFDRELLFVASALHDLGLTPDGKGRVDDVRAARRTGGTGRPPAVGPDVASADLMHDAIPLHLELSSAAR
jgi:hypothetical protein